MYDLSTIIIVIHKVFYEAKNGQTEGSESQIQGHFDAGEGVPGRGQSHQWRNTPIRTEQVRMDTESLAFSGREG